MATRLYPTFHTLPIDFASDDIRAMLVNDTISYNRLHDFVNDVVAGELAGAERQVLSSKTVTDNGSTAVVFDCADITFPTVDTSLTANAVILFRQVTNDTDSNLVAYMDGSNITTNGQDVIATVNASGLFALAY